MSNTLSQLQRAKEIVDRFNERGKVFPRELRDCGRTDPVRKQEYRDACKIKTWRYSLMGKNRYTCSEEVRNYLDENMPGWRDYTVHSRQDRSNAMSRAKEIVQRYRERGCVRPRRFNDPARQQEYKDAVYLSTWKSALKGHNRAACSTELREYLDANIPDWRDDHRRHRGDIKERSLSATTSSPSPDTGLNTGKRISTAVTKSNTQREPPSTEALMPVASAIVQRYKERGCVLPSLTTECREDPSRAQEHKDAGQLHSWKIHTSEKLTPEVLSFLDSHMPGWRNKKRNSTCSRTVSKYEKDNPIYAALMKAREIVQRCSNRTARGLHHLPRHLNGRQEAPELILEQNDARKLREWKRTFEIDCENRFEEGSQKGGAKFPWELKTYLDRELKDWMLIDCEDSYSSLHQSDASAMTTHLKQMEYHSDHASDHLQSFQKFNSDIHMRPVSDTSKSAYFCNDLLVSSDELEAEQQGVAALLQLRNISPSTTLQSNSSPTKSSASGQSLDSDYCEGRAAFASKRPRDGSRDENGTQNISPTTTTSSGHGSNDSDTDVQNSGHSSKRPRDEVRNENVSPCTSVEISSNA